MCFPAGLSLEQAASRLRSDSVQEDQDFLRQHGYLTPLVEPAPLPQPGMQKLDRVINDLSAYLAAEESELVGV